MSPDGLSFRAPFESVTGRLALLYHVGVIIVSAAIAGPFRSRSPSSPGVCSLPGP